MFEELIEARIRKAMEDGELDNLEGMGRPLNLDDDAMIAPELRMAYRILKNAGYVPEEVGLRREIGETEELCEFGLGDGGRSGALRRLGLLRARLAAAGGGAVNLQVEDPHFRKTLERLGE